MSETLSVVRALVAAEKVRVSDHAYEEIVADGLLLEVLLRGVISARLVEDYPFAFKGPSILVLQYHFSKPVHVVWGLPKSGSDFTTLVTAYLPDPKRWYDDFLERRTQ